MRRRCPLPPYPNGWFRVADSDEIGRGEARGLRYFGREILLLRGEDGAARVFDAHCPHLGAHLGHGGRVEGDAIRCPFHAWRFGPDGRCVEIPYARRIPPRAALRPWPVCERNGLVMVWHHAGGEAPSWEIPEVADWSAEGWSPPQRRSWKVRAHSQEMAENVVDDAHFKYVHGTHTMPRSTAEIDGHVFRAVSISKVGTPRGEVEGRIDIETHGFGFGVTRFRGVIETLLIVSGAPIDEEYSETTIRFRVRTLGNADADRGVGRAFIAEIERQFGQDIPIWENKIHLERPVLCDGDGPIGLLRKYARQFYSPEAPDSRPAAGIA